MQEQAQSILPKGRDVEVPMVEWELDDDEDVAIIDRMIQSMLARMTLGIYPGSIMEAYADWLRHLVVAPGKQSELVQKAARKFTRFWLYANKCAQGRETPPCIDPLPQDKRFRADAWQTWPFNFTYQSFLLTQQWWYNASTGIQGVSKRHEDIVEFVNRQMLDVFSPSNMFFTNPEVLNRTLDSGGLNLRDGFMNFLEDWERNIAGRKPVGSENFVPGRHVAVTPGKVIYQNRLMELIQYSPTTETVYAEPVLIVPAWIMKYYILDLSPENSLVKYLVDQGHTVFMISWLNPKAKDRELSMDSYRQKGVMKALDVVSQLIPNQKIHGVGYCLGGTLLAIAAARMAQSHDQRLKTITLLAAQTDFSEAGELMLFIDEGAINYLENMMWEQGYLDTKQMAGAFQILRSNDLVWSRLVRNYLMGERRPLNDLMAWNADATRMPYRMHSEYLRHLFLNNELAEGKYQVDGDAISVSDIKAPIFSVATLRDHVAPWHSVYKLNLLTDTDVIFLLTTGGHNAGIVSEPGHPGRKYQISKKTESDHHIDPDRWHQTTPWHDGSWWPEWQSWLASHSSGRVAPPGMGDQSGASGPLDDAPGTYVLQP